MLKKKTQMEGASTKLVVLKYVKIMKKKDRTVIDWREQRRYN